MQKLRWGILSAANIAYEQFKPAIEETNHQEIVAIASKSPEKVERFGIEKVYADYKDLLHDPTIDAIYIPLPNHLHKEWAIKAMQADKHVLLEKPAALTGKDMQDIQAVVKETGKIFLEGFMYQYHPQHLYVKQLLEDGAIGEVQFAKAHFSFYLENEADIRLHKAFGGGAIWDIGCYGIHALTQIAKIKPRSVTTVSDIDIKHDVDVSSTSIFQDERGRLATVTCSFKGAFSNSYDLYGEKGKISVLDAFRPDASPSGEGTVQVFDINDHLIEEVPFHANQYRLQLEQFHDAVERNVQPDYDVDRSTEMVHYIEKAYESLAKKTSVYI